MGRDISKYEISPVERLRAIVAASLGNLVEWYDWYIYSFGSLYFARSFFPRSDQTVQLLQTAAIFAIGFLMRPVGGWLMGRYADRKGRKAALTFSVLLMSIGSLLIALTPSYLQIGLAAPALLLLARVIQGFSVGGEYGTSATYLSEIAGRRRRGFYSSFQYVTLIMGQLIAAGLLVMLQRFWLSERQLYGWGWRIPFLVGALLALTVLYLRRGLREPESFVGQRAAEGKGSLRVLFQYPAAVLTVAGLTIGGTVAFYTFTTYMQKFLVNTTGFTNADANLLSTLSLLLFMLMQPVFGLLSDRIGRKPLLVTFALLGTVMTIPLMRMLSTAKSWTEAFLLIIAALLITSGYTSINAVVKAELFPARIRALGVGFPYAVTVSVFGGTAETLALAFRHAGHPQWFYTYVSGCIFISLLTYTFTVDTSKYSKIED